MAASEDTTPARPGPVLGWALLAALLVYTFSVHHGIGPEPNGISPPWYAPQNFLFDFELTLPIVENFSRAVLFIALPAGMLAIGVFLATRSALARALAVSCVLGVLLLLFYGIVAPDVWVFFHWRGSAVILLTALSVGCAATSPWLAASWLRLGWPVRAAIYAPVFVTVVALIRNTTGTDESLRFAISPWPAISVFGIEVGAMFVSAGLLGVSLCLFSIDFARGRSGGRSTLVQLGGIALGLGAPLLLLAVGAWIEVLPFTLGFTTLFSVFGSCLIVLVAAAAGGGDPEEALPRRARLAAVGGLLVGVPLVIGQVFARLDYHVTREIRAQAIIDGLESYLERETIYPESLEALVEAGDLASLPRPTIGFDALYDHDFRYRDFGMSFILEFAAPRWVECAYTPPYEDDEDGDDSAVSAAGDDDDDDLSFGAWSCPSTPPKLW
jgi:hypothetical protein